MVSAHIATEPFRIPVRLPLLTGVFERMLGLTRLNQTYKAIQAAGGDLDDFLEHALEELGVRHEVVAGALESIPARGPLVVVCNHPYGGVEGIVLALLLRKVRKDVRMVATEMLSRLPELRELFLLVDVFGGESAIRRNVAVMKKAMRWTQDGGALIVFPAGEVSHLQLHRGRIEDPPWNPHVARFIRRSGACVTPIRFDGANGPIFQLAGLLHPRLRTMLLGREILNKRHLPLQLRIGTTVPSSRLSGLPDETMMRYLRMRTYLLGASKTGGRAADGGAPDPIVARDTGAVLQAEIDALPAEQHLFRRGRFLALTAWAHEAPRLLREIGRERERSFRGVGEGTGAALDVDDFDESYVHLILWDSDERRVAGAYRLGLADTLLRRHGHRGLYTNTLFQFDDAFFARTGAAIELGRSFVAPEYQKHSKTLFLLWKGIGAFLVRYKHYRFLFGPVSISSRYARVSQSLMLNWLRRHAWAHDFAPFVHPRNPPPSFRGAPGGDALLGDIRDLSDAVGDLEVEHRGVPVLIREYLRLGGRYAGFNLDPDFSDVIDGLIVIDLLDTDVRTLGRYLGAEDAHAFQDYHRSLRHVVAQGRRCVSRRSG